MYQDQADPAHQIHDFNPGITESGLFWTVPIPDDSVDVHLGAGKASMDVDDLALDDYFNLINALSVSPDQIPASVSFHLRWHLQGELMKIRNTEPMQGYAGQFYINEDVADAATIEWSGQNADGDEFFSVSSECHFALLGHERNGSFFPQAG